MLFSEILVQFLELRGRYTSDVGSFAYSRHQRIMHINSSMNHHGRIETTRQKEEID